VGEAEGADRLEALTETAADVIIVNLASADESTVPRAVRRLRATGARVVALTDDSSRTQVSARAALLAGAWAVQNTEAVPAVLFALVESACREERPRHDLPGVLWEAAMDESRAELTGREREIVDTLANDPGQTTANIALTLGMSPHTVSTHLANIRHKLGDRAVTNRTALLGALRDKGWLH
jgi:DNA-binding NarL/FixJ family response regulator